jgi:dephospho-CoA kinase
VSTPRAIAIGLTGGIGSGKSAASAILRELGATVIDADKVGHEVYVPSRPAWNEIVAEFGRDVVSDDGTIDRRTLGGLVFADASRLKKLNAIVQPRIASEIASRIRRLRDEGDRTPIVVEAAVLLEAGWQWLVDEIWVVTVTAEHAIERVAASRGLDRGEIVRRIASQLPDTQRTREAAYVLHNDGTLADLRAALERAWRTRVLREA